jgi:hypothetical protein
MRLLLLPFTAVLATALVPWSAPDLLGKPAAQPNKNTVVIEGYLFDSKGKGIPDVDVTVWVVGKADAIRTKKSEDNGHYKVEVEVSEAFDVAYSLTKYRQAIFTHLAESKNQQISTVLYTTGEKMSVSAAHASIQAVDRIAFLASALPKEKRKGFLGHFGDLEVPAKDGVYSWRPLLIGEVPDDQQRILSDDTATAYKHLLTIK